MSGITNIHFGEDNPTWLQVTLPMKMGGLGIRSVVQFVSSAFLASAVASSALVHHIIPPALQCSPIPNWDDAMDTWSEGYSEAPPEELAQHRQKIWDNIKSLASANLLGTYQSLECVSPGNGESCWCGT